MLKIKRLGINDFKLYKSSIFKLLVDSYKINFNLIDEEAEKFCKEKLENIPKYLEESSAILLGAFEANILAGFLWLYKYNYLGENRLHINQIIVDKQFRGSGVGSQLLKECEKIAHEFNIKTIDLYVSEANKNALKLYNSFGYSLERRYMKKDL